MRTKLTNRQELVLFFVLAFGIGWLAFIPAMIYNFYPTPSAFIFLFSPALAALITSGLTGGRAGMQELLGRYLVWRFPARWYVLAVALLPLIFLVAAGVTALQTPAELWTGSSWYFVVASFCYLIFINSGEEIGWRGFALPRLEGVIPSRLLAGIVLGVFWGLWHLPLYLDPRQSSFPLALFLLFIVGLSVIYSVVSAHTGGSLLAAVLLHAGTDVAPRFIQIGNFGMLSWAIVVILVWAAAVSLYFLTRPRTATV